MSAQTAVTVGDHDPMVFEGGSALGVWVECECGWISPSYYTQTNALKSHDRHVVKATS